VNKLLHRIVAVDYHNNVSSDDGDFAVEETTEMIHEYTHGICSDPMAIFAIVFSALIHDVDHQGISNVQLSKEEPLMGANYRNTSVAEQNSLGT
jgi:3'5'-cyclic nucleotide phosphodiesterase